MPVTGHESARLKTLTVVSGIDRRNVAKLRKRVKTQSKEIPQEQNMVKYKIYASLKALRPALIQDVSWLAYFAYSPIYIGIFVRAQNSIRVFSLVHAAVCRTNVMMALFIIYALLDL